MGHLVTKIVTNVAFVLSVCSNGMNMWFLFHPSEDPIQNAFSYVGMILSAASGFWISPSGVGIDADFWEFFKAVMGPLLTLLGPLFDIMFNWQDNCLMMIPFILVELIFFGAPFINNKKIVAILTFVPPALNLVSIAIQFGGFLLFHTWQFTKWDALVTFLNAIYTFCGLVNSLGNIPNMVMICFAGIAKVAYGVLILYRYYGGETIYNSLREFVLFFVAVGEVITACCKKCLTKE